MKRTFVFVLAILSLVFTNSFGGSKTGADFLKIPIGARSIGIGQAYTALAEDADALNWNPAGIVPASNRSEFSSGSFSLSHQELFFGNNLDYLAVALPGKKFSLGLSVTRFSYPDQEARDADRNKTGSFGASDLAVGTALGINLKGFRMGSQLKIIKQTLANESAAGIALDLGLLAPTPFSGLVWGASVQNLGPSMHFIQEDYSLPLTLSIGAAYQMTSPLVVALDLRSLPRQNQTSLSFGTEFSALNSVVLRAGYLAKVASAISNTQQSETNRGTLSGITGFNAGLGIKISRFKLDYALSPFGELGNVQSLTLSTSFGGARLVKEVQTPAETDRVIIILPQSKEGQELNADTTTTPPAEKPTHN